MGIASIYKVLKLGKFITINIDLVFIASKILSHEKKKKLIKKKTFSLENLKKQNLGNIRKNPIQKFFFF